MYRYTRSEILENSNIELFLKVFTDASILLPIYTIYILAEVLGVALGCFEKTVEKKSNILEHFF